MFAQEGKIPDINLLRAEESYAYLDSVKEKIIFLQPLKRIAIDRRNSFYLSLGGEYRARLEHYTNENYTSNDLTYYLQRINLHVSLQLGAKLHLFGELYSGYVTGNQIIGLESDEVGVHQGFLEWKPVNSSNLQAMARFGRQEIGYGTSRLVGIREGPNMRRSFDMARVVIRKNNSSIDLLYGKEVDISPFSFDNTSNIFKGGASNPSFWGAYHRRPFLKDIGKLDLYYFGFYTNRSRFNDVSGMETRHSIGIRSFSVKGRLSYNTEIIVQWGKLGSSTISAYNIEADWKYTLIENGWKPKLGITADWSSGDKEIEDGRVDTFNPLFVNPAIYSLAAVNTPANITSLHPNLTFYPIKGLVIYLDYAIFYRTESNDGLYAPPRFLTREVNGLRTKHIGNVFGLQLSYEVNRNISFDLRSSYFIAGQFIKASGDSENTFYIAPTMSFKF
ncbi:alginate export family protein [Flagellimonas sp. HMM57]|uniref:alginate export family protein n=1 Tax=unclassified Flagellimonas TaxID=2644544 RepID=UPI0013D1BAC5|nr:MULTISPECIES: alginate export family protein [unclassified Flagellimonas]UII77238.1 alginate export family protein [Flagellimonas sp. HMM57]